jgi:hypothetical protein
MNLVALTVEQMVAISSDWLSVQRGTLTAISYTACHLEDLESVHRVLVGFLPKSIAVPVELQVLIDKGIVFDRKHDRLYRGCNRAFECQAYFAEAEEEEADLLEMQAHYFPRGDGGTILSHQEESGATLILFDKLSSTEPPHDEYNKKLQNLIVAKKDGNDISMYDKLLALSAVGRELGDNDKAKSAALSKWETEQRASTGESGRKAQYEWIDVVKMIVDGIARHEKKTPLSAEQRVALLGPLEKAQELSQKRAKRAQKITPIEGTPTKPDALIPPGSTSDNTEAQ